MKTLKIHYFQHVSFEGLGCIEEWILEQNHEISSTKFYEKNYKLPTIEEIDWLIVMGGPMGVTDTSKYTWLIEEKEFIKKAIKAEKTVIGICLGSQLIAESLGAKIYKNSMKEIGWFPLQTKAHDLTQHFESEFIGFHWHGETYELPKKSSLLFSSEACENQGFLYKENVLGLQFHFEVTKKTLQEMVMYGMNELVKDRFVQSSEEILLKEEYILQNNQKIKTILNYLAH